MSDIKIREIKPKDNLAIAKLIKSVLVEFGAPKVGTAYEDDALKDMYKAYNGDSKAYFVVTINDEVVGGAGIDKLEGCDLNICELQKMYFSPLSRGKGLGQQMMLACLAKAKSIGYDQCYLETLPYMIGATKLYKKTGFKSVENPIGDTGHYSCTMYMLKDL